MPSRPLHGIASTATPLAKNGQRFPQNGQRFFKTTERFFLGEALSRTESIDTSKKTVRLSEKLYDFTANEPFSGVKARPPTHRCAPTSSRATTAQRVMHA